MLESEIAHAKTEHSHWVMFQDNFPLSLRSFQFLLMNSFPGQNHVTCPNLLYISLMMTKSKLGKKWLCGFYFQVFCPLWTEVRARIQSRNLRHHLKQKPWRKFCVLSCSACFLIQLITICLWMAPPTLGWALPYQHLSLLKKMPIALACKPT